MSDISPAPEDRLRITADAGDATTFLLDGELDPHTSPMLQRRIDDESTAASKVVLDFSAVTFVDSAGLRVIADTHRRLSEGGGQLIVKTPSPGLTKLLSLTGLADHVTIEE